MAVDLEGRVFLANGRLTVAAEAGLTGAARYHRRNPKQCNGGA
jgi:hypothetical protein